MIRSLLLAIAMTLSPAVPLFASHPHDFQTGTLVDIKKDEQLIDGTTVSRTVFEVQVGNLIYEAQSRHTVRASAKFAEHVVVGDPIKVAIEGDEMILLDNSGNELKMKITRQERAK